MSLDKFVIDLDKPNSIDKAIKYLKEYKRRIANQKQHDFLDALGAKMELFLDNEYSAGKERKRVHVTHTVSGNDTLVVSANGKRMLFIEFGSGTPADSSQGVKYGFGAGSWSNVYGIGTYQKWLESGGVLYSYNGHYKYDRYAKDAFLLLENELPRLIKEAADEVFG